MRDWMDFNGDGEVDSTERFLGAEMLCGSREEHEALFGDEVKHNSQIYDYEKCKLPIHIFRELEIIDNELRNIQAMLIQESISKAIIVSDHGASRLAVISGEENSAFIEMDEKGEHSGRCCPIDDNPNIKYAAYEDGYAVLANYERFKGGRKANVEVHGGATLEEVIVPIITLTKKPSNVEYCFTESLIILKQREVAIKMNIDVFYAVRSIVNCQKKKKREYN